MGPLPRHVGQVAARHEEDLEARPGRAEVPAEFDAAGSGEPYVQEHAIDAADALEHALGLLRARRRPEPVLWPERISQRSEESMIVIDGEDALPGIPDPGACREEFAHRGDRLEGRRRR